MTKFVRVKDPETGHQFSLPDGDRLIERGLVTVLDRPATSAALPPKHHVDITTPKRTKRETSPQED